MANRYRTISPEKFIGQRIGRLIVQSLDGFALSGKRTRWWCRCDCGTHKSIRHQSLFRASRPTLSCGCLQREHSGSLPKHGQSHRKRTRTYRAWEAMLARCYNHKNNRYHLYGGRGITVCERWRNSFMNFYADLGDCLPGMTLERKDGTRNYEPDNCCWATYEAQANNKRNNRLLTFEGKTLTMAQWERQRGLPLHIVRQRLELGWSVEEALTRPVRITKHKERSYVPSL